MTCLWYTLPFVLPDDFARIDVCSLGFPVRYIGGCVRFSWTHRFDALVTFGFVQPNGDLFGLNVKSDLVTLAEYYLSFLLKRFGAGERSIHYTQKVQFAWYVRYVPFFTVGIEELDLSFGMSFFR